MTPIKTLEEQIQELSDNWHVHHSGDGLGRLEPEDVKEIARFIRDLTEQMIPGEREEETGEYFGDTTLNKVRGFNEAVEQMKKKRKEILGEK